MNVKEACESVKTFFEARVVEAERDRQLERAAEQASYLALLERLAESQKSEIAAEDLPPPDDTTLAKAQRFAMLRGEAKRAKDRVTERKALRQLEEQLDAACDVIGEDS